MPKPLPLIVKTEKTTETLQTSPKGYKHRYVNLGIGKQEFTHIVDSFIEVKASWKLWLDMYSPNIIRSTELNEQATTARKKCGELINERESLDEVISDLFNGQTSARINQNDLDQLLLEKYILSLQIRRAEWVIAMYDSSERVNRAVYQTEFKRYAQARTLFTEAGLKLSNAMQDAWKKIHPETFNKDEFDQVFRHLLNNEQEPISVQVNRFFDCHYEYSKSYHELFVQVEEIINEPYWLEINPGKMNSSLIDSFGSKINQLPHDKAGYESLRQFAKQQLRNGTKETGDFNMLCQAIIDNDLITLSHLYHKAQINTQLKQEASAAHLYQQLNVLLVPFNQSPSASQQQINELGKQLATVTADKQYQVDLIIKLVPFLDQLEKINEEIETEVTNIQSAKAVLLDPANASSSSSNSQPSSTLVFSIVGRTYKDKIHQLKKERQRLIDKNQPLIHQAIAALSKADISERIYINSLETYASSAAQSDHSTAKNIASSSSSFGIFYDHHVEYQKPLVSILQQRLNTTEVPQISYPEIMKKINTILNHPHWQREEVEPASMNLVIYIKKLLSDYSHLNSQQQFKALHKKAVQLAKAENNFSLFRQNLPDDIRLLIYGIINHDLVALNLLTNKIDGFEQERPSDNLPMFP